MKIMIMGLTIFSCAVVACGEVFQMDRKGDAIVEVQKSGEEYKVTCSFSPQTKFDKAINAKFNDAKGDSLCKKGLARYLNVGTNETLAVSGLYSAAPVEGVGGRLCYSFGVPVSGCSILEVEVKSEQPVEASKPDVEVEPQLEQPGDLPKPDGEVEVKPEQPDEQPDEQPKMDGADLEPSKEPTNAAARKTSYMCVVKYREINGKRKEISHREYRRRNFKSMKEFDRFCQAEFARVRAKGEANLRAVRNARR